MPRTNIQMARLEFFPTSNAVACFEPTVELHQIGTFEGLFTDWATALQEEWAKYLDTNEIDVLNGFSQHCKTLSWRQQQIKVHLSFYPNIQDIFFLTSIVHLPSKRAAFNRFGGLKRKSVLIFGLL